HGFAERDRGSEHLPLDLHVAAALLRFPLPPAQRGGRGHGGERPQQDIEPAYCFDTIGTDRGDAKPVAVQQVPEVGEREEMDVMARARIPLVQWCLALVGKPW